MRRSILAWNIAQGGFFWRWSIYEGKIAFRIQCSAEATEIWVNRRDERSIRKIVGNSLIVVVQEFISQGNVWFVAD